MNKLEPAAGNPRQPRVQVKFVKHNPAMQNMAVADSGKHSVNKIP